MTVGRLLDELNYAWFEDPIRTIDQRAWSSCARRWSCRSMWRIPLLDCGFRRVHQEGALDVVRLIADNVGGISGSMRVGLLADASGWNARRTTGATCWTSPSTSTWSWRCRTPTGSKCRSPRNTPTAPYHNDKFRLDADGYILAPTEPGLGYPIDRAALDKMTNANRPLSRSAFVPQDWEAFRCFEPGCFCAFCCW